MRDLAIILIVFGMLPFVFKRPWLGIMMWAWISVMNPHRLSWGFAYDFPFALIIAVVTIISLFFKKERLSFPWSAAPVLLLLFVLWMNVTTLFAMVPAEAYEQWDKVMKIMLMTFITLLAIDEKRHIDWLIWVLALSLAFYGIKGGIFTLRGGGTDLVWGPPGTFIEDNNHLAVALVMSIPLLWYLRGRLDKRWMRWGLVGVMGLCAMAALGSYSRGALLCLTAMAGFLWLKSRQKFQLAIFVCLLAPAMIVFMPDQWYVRMDTIVNYDTDSSAIGRINAWQTAFNIAKDHPLVGGGFQLYEPQVFAKYAPNPEDLHAAHSIYFAALGEHGFIGLALFLMFGVATWRTGTWIVKRSKSRPDLRWAMDLALMVQVSLVGYAVGGAFLSILYFDLPYYLMAVLVLLKEHVRRTLAAKPAPSQLQPQAVLVTPLQLDNPVVKM